MIKVLSPNIVKEVGTTAALLLQHINYWMFTQNKNKIFRTNNELIQDLNGMFTLFQIQYAKKKLVDNGFLVVTYDKKFDRTTHYTFTEKAISLLKEHTDYLLSKTQNKTSRKTPLNERTSIVYKQSGTYVPKQQNIAVASNTEELDVYDESEQFAYSEMKAPKYDSQGQKYKTKVVQQTNKSMQKAFEEQGEKRSNVVREIPESLKYLLKNKRTEKKEVDVSPINEGNITNVVEFLEPINEDSVTNVSEFLETTVKSDNKDISLSQTLAMETLDTISVFKRPPNVDIREKNRIMMESVINFKEEY